MSKLNSTDWHRNYGSPWPLGVLWIEESRSYNFALYSKHATQVELLFFSNQSIDQPLRVINLDPRLHKSGPVWHARVPRSDIDSAQYYAYRVDGPPYDGGYDIHFFDKQKLLVDPYAKDIFFPPSFDRTAACTPGDNSGKAPLGVLPAAASDFFWGDDCCPRHGSDLIIYEVHVRGFTRHSSSAVPAAHRGTFLGVIDKIPYLKELGITAVELMPVFQFDPQEGNYWGYMPLSFFAPHEAYASKGAAEDQHSEFREMVKQLHLADIEVILDVVYNHTCEGNEDGPNYCFKGIDASTYYTMSQRGGSAFANFSGTGNTLHTANRATRQLIVDSLRYWVREMHVDGFRFDLASIFTRDSSGAISVVDPPIFGQIAADPDLAGIRLIAEPWDMGAYQLGRGFPGTQWMQWNSAYQRCVQGFVRGDKGLVPELMTRIHGSTDLFPDDCFHALRPFQSINYVTSHDSFTLYDLVSYNRRHNEANGHGGVDGNHDLSWNCGSEGDECVDNKILDLRIKQAKNLFLLTMLSAGTPMFRMGDEFFQSQGGNNNPYNQDNETSWLDWERINQFQNFHQFCKRVIAFRKMHSLLCRPTFWHDAIQWYGQDGPPDLSENSQCLAYCLHGTQEDPYDLYVMLNASAEHLNFKIHERRPEQWQCVFDTADRDLLAAARLPAGQDTVALEPRSIVVLRASHSTGID